MPSANRLACFEIGRRRLAPNQIRVRRIREAARDGRLDAALQVEEAFGRTVLRRDERQVALVDVARDELRAVGVRARDEDRRHVVDVRGEASRDERANELRRRHEHFAAHVSALLLARELILEMHARGARFDHALHQLVRVERPAEPGFRVREDWGEPVMIVFAFAVLDLIRAKQRRVDAANDVRYAVDRVEALVGIHASRGVRIGGDLPAREINRLEPRAHLLNRLVSRERAERGDVRLFVEERPQALGAEARKRVFYMDRSAEARHVGLRIRPHDSLKTTIRDETRKRNCGAHGSSPEVRRSYAGSVRNSSNRSARTSASKSLRASAKRFASGSLATSSDAIAR